MQAPAAGVGSGPVGVRVSVSHPRHGVAAALEKRGGRAARRPAAGWYSGFGWRCLETPFCLWTQRGQMPRWRRMGTSWLCQPFPVVRWTLLIGNYLKAQPRGEVAGSGGVPAGRGLAPKGCGGAG